jgi:hypothetical protein
VQRSRVTVEYNYLPGQVFEHEVEGLYCVVREVDGRQPELPLPQVLEALAVRLQQWQAAAGIYAGFPPRVAEYAESFRLVRPSEVLFDVWPQRVACRRCGDVRRLGAQGETLESRSCRRAGCAGVYRQLPYYQVHACGRRQQLVLPSCRDHGDRTLAFVDSDSFYTAGFRCTTPGCGRWLPMEFRTCSCGQGQTAGERSLLPVTARDSRAYYGHHLTMINVASAKLSEALAAPRGPHYALGHYLGTITNLSGLADHIRGRDQQNTGAAEDLLTLLNQQQGGLDPELAARVRALADAQRGDAPALEATERVLEPATIEAARTDRRMMERAFLYTDHAVEPLDAIAERWRTAGHGALAARIDAGLEAAYTYGLRRISVVRDFPVALVGFGYTRSHADSRAVLQPFEPRRDDEKLPLIAVDADTEGLLIELDPVTLWHWCQANGWTDGPEPDQQGARAFILDHGYSQPQTEAGLAIARVTHVISHLLVHALARRSSFAANSVAEYLLPRTASSLIYVAKYTTFNLGGLIALAEQHLVSWLDDAIEAGRTCVHDPVCLDERGGCHKCLALAFGCERFNRGLDRGYLLGGGTQGINEGFLRIAGRHARTQTTTP